MYKVTAKIEHGNQTDTNHYNKVSEKDLDEVKADIRKDAPVGSTVTIETRRWTGK